jgi:hypothetical protein
LIRLSGLACVRSNQKTPKKKHQKRLYLTWHALRPVPFGCKGPGAPRVANPEDLNPEGIPALSPPGGPTVTSNLPAVKPTRSRAASVRSLQTRSTRARRITMCRRWCCWAHGPPRSRKAPSRSSSERFPAHADVDRFQDRSRSTKVAEDSVEKLQCSASYANLIIPSSKLE